MDPLVISVKDLGNFALAWACRRCLWVGLHAKSLPYQSFPGIFSSIDVYNKRIVHQYFDRVGSMPSWLECLGDAESYVNPPTYHKFFYHDPHLNVTIRGTPDGVFRMRDGSYTIVDYKTSRFTAGQERMLPIYRTQLNGYAFLGNRLGLGPVSQIALIYMEPVTDEGTAALPEMVNCDGFTMGLSATVVPVRLDPGGTIPRLMARARDIYDLEAAPEPRDGCRNCSAVLDLVSLLGR